MDLATLALFSAAALALTASPGPDMLLIASRSAAQGRMAGFATWAGIAVGTYCHALAAALGLSQLFLALPLAYDVVRFAGAAYLLFLAWQAFTSKAPQLDAGAKPLRARTTVQMFTQGLLTNVLNPKMVIFVLALFPQFIDPAAGSVALQIMIMATIINLFGLCINGAVILGAAGAASLIAGSAGVRRGMQMVLGTVFAGLAARLALDVDR